MLPMPDGVRLATDIYRPKNAQGAVPTIWVRTPYNFNFWDIQNGVPADMSAQLTAVKRGYAYVVQNERGHFFSEGNYDILGSKKDGYNTIEWITKQPWSNGKLGTTGCSSTAEYQMGIAALGHPGYAAMNVQGFGAGVGRVGPYYEQGNWYRGGAVQMLFIAWLYGEQNQVRPMFPARHVARGSRARVEIVRPRAASAARRLVEGAVAPARAGHHQERRRPARDFRDGDAGRNRRQDDPAHAERFGVVPRRPLSRRSEAERARALVHVVVRRVGRPEPGALQPRAGNGGRRRERRPVGGDRSGRALLVHARHRRHDCRRAQHGRRAIRLQRHRLRFLRSVPQRRKDHAPRHAAKGHLLHDGPQQMADLRHVAAGWCAPDDVLSVERGKSQHALRRRFAGTPGSPARNPLRPTPTSPTRSPTTR